MHISQTQCRGGKARENVLEIKSSVEGVIILWNTFGVRAFKNNLAEDLSAIHPKYEGLVLRPWVNA